VVLSAAPRGWLGYFFVHGAASMSYAKKYMDGGLHICADVSASWDKSGEGTVHITSTESTLLVNRFAEWPCPAIPRCSPRFLGGDTHDPWEALRGGQIQDAIQWFHTTNNKNMSFMYGGINRDFDAWLPLPVEETVWVDGVQITRMRRPWCVGEQIWLEEAMIGSDGRCYVKHKLGIHPIKPAANVMKYIETTVETPALVKDKQLSNGLLQLAPNADRQLVCPPYWRATWERKARWWRRIVRWYYTAAWLVWCGEMVRLHCVHTRNIEAPHWWRNHCAAWGIGVPTNAQQVRVHYDSTGYLPGLSIHDEGISADWIWKRLQLIVGTTPIPGTAGATGEQIVPDDVNAAGDAIHHRHILDIPPEAGAIAPPISLRDWMLWMTAQWSQATPSGTNYDAAAPWIMMVANAVFSIAGSGAASSIATSVASTIGQTASTAIMKIATAICSKLWDLVKSGDFDFNIDTADVVGLIGTAVDAVGVGAGIDLKGVPASLWDNLKQAGAQLESFGDWSQNAPTLYAIQSALAGLRKSQGWDYFDEAYGGLGLSQVAKDSAD